MGPGPTQKLQRESTSRTRGAARNGREQTKATPALPRQRTSRSRRLKMPAPDISTAVERNNGRLMKALGNHASTLGKDSSMRKNSRGKPRGKPSGVVRDEIASLARLQRQEEEVSSRDKSAISPETDAVPMPRWRTSSIREEASQYHADRARDFDFQRLTEALGSQDPDFVWGLVMQLAHASTRFHDGQLFNFMLSVIKSIHPRDAIEAMLGAQMSAVLMTVMNYVDELARLDCTMDPQRVNFRQEIALQAVNKLCRTFATLVGALKHYRAGGEQKPTFGHVSVRDNGQAILGAVNQAPHDVLPEKTPTATPTLTDGRQTAMDIVSEPQRAPIPLRRRRKG